MFAVTWELPSKPGVLAGWWPHVCALGSTPTYLGSTTEETWYSQRIPRSEYDHALEVLTIASALCLDGRAVSSLHDLGIRWAPECCGEVWRSWDVLVARGRGDCEDLAAAHAAWLRCNGYVARAAWLRQGPRRDEAGDVYHAVVLDGHGQTIDIARELGMSDDVACDIAGPCGKRCDALRPTY